MEISSVTIGLPVRDLARAMGWYQRVSGLNEPDLQPADGVVEFQLGPVWLQLGEEVTTGSGAEAVTRFGVADAKSEHSRLASLGVAVGPLEHVDGAVDYFDFADLDGNVLSTYSMTS